VAQSDFAYILLLVAACVLWSLPARRALDLPSWHEFDDATIARNYVTESGGFASPRIDWRRDGPGIAETEFPLFPWLMSQMYRYFGVDIIWGRILSLAFTTGALVFFVMIARLMLPHAGAVFAGVVFIANPLIYAVSTSLQPEGLMLFFYLAAAYCFLHWREKRSPWAYWVGIASTSLAVLEKAPAGHIGLFFLMLVLADDGWAALKDKRNWLFGILAFAAPALWYAHAHRLWVTYGNSLGISNENHWFGPDVLRRPGLVAGLIANEAVFVFAIGGAVLAILGAMNWRRDRQVKSMLLWCASLLIYYVMTIRTTGAYWAAYYHVVSVPPVALLAGAGAARFIGRRASRSVVAAAVLAAGFVILAVVAAVQKLNPGQLAKIRGHVFIHDLVLANFSVSQALLVLVYAALGVALIELSFNPATPSPVRTPNLLYGLSIGTYLVVSAQLIGGDLARYRTPTPEWQCAEKFRAALPRDGLLVASGYTCDDGYGHRIAYDAPQMFYWLDRKGFSICAGEQSLTALMQLKKRGATSFAAEKATVDLMPGFEQQLKASVPVLAACDAGWLFDLGRIRTDADPYPGGESK
jgi:4-amino-4-deoxy-L-arabinose transferase-like glycosyltransferase